MIQIDEKLEMLNSKIDSIIKNDLYVNRQIKSCPFCGSTRYIKYGKYSGIQRFKCKKDECEKTFSQTTNSLWSYSKKSSKKWIEFMELMMEKRTLRYCAKKLEINLGTAFNWRHKVLNGLVNIVTPKKLFDFVHIGKTVIKENFKGCRNIETSDREDIWIVAASGGKDTILSVPVCKKKWDLENFKLKVYSKIDKNSYIITHGDRYLQLVAKKHNKEFGKKEEIIDDRIKYFRGNLTSWVSTFYGIGTKYLKQYLCWFILFYLERKIDYINMSYDLVKGDTFIKTADIRMGYESA